MKKLFNILVILMALVLFVTGCNSTSAPDDSTDDKVTDTKPTDKPTEAPTDKPTEAPTDKPTEEPSETLKPSERGENAVYSEDFEKYKVVTDDASGGEVKTLANNLIDTVNSCWGVTTTLVYDKDTEVSDYEILVGDTDRPESKEFKESLEDGECGYRVIGKKIVILGSEDQYTETAIVLFANFMLHDKDTSVKQYMTEENTHVVDATNMLSVMSYNIRVDYGNNNISLVSTMIRNYMPDILGVQEADQTWMKLLNERLSKSGYAYVGIGRDSGGKGETSAIFYRTDKLEVLDSVTLWLSETPDIVSKVRGSNCNRIVTMAVFKRISDGKVFVHANTHLDHSNADVRSQQVTFLDQYVKDFANGLEFMVTGDFNFQPDNRVYAQLMDLKYENCAKLAKFARGRDDNTYTGGSMIDFCFRHDTTAFEPYFYTVCDELIDGKTPSDHHPIFLIIELE